MIFTQLFSFLLFSFLLSSIDIYSYIGIKEWYNHRGCLVIKHQTFSLFTLLCLSGKDDRSIFDFCHLLNIIRYIFVYWLVLRLLFYFLHEYLFDLFLTSPSFIDSIFYYVLYTFASLLFFFNFVSTQWWLNCAIMQNVAFRRNLIDFRMKREKNVLEPFFNENFNDVH